MRFINKIVSKKEITVASSFVSSYIYIKIVHIIITVQLPRLSFNIYIS